MTFVQKEFKTSLRKEQRHRRSRPAGHKKAPHEEGHRGRTMSWRFMPKLGPISTSEKVTDMTNRIFMILNSSSNPEEALFKLYDRDASEDKDVFVMALVGALLLRQRQWETARLQSTSTHRRGDPLKPAFPPPPPPRPEKRR